MDSLTQKDAIVVNAARLVCDLNAEFVRKCADADNSTAKPWVDMSDAARKGFIALMYASIANPAKTPEESHNRWIASKEASGWTYGEVANAELKQHPNLVPWNELSAIEQYKDAIFTQVVLRAVAMLKESSLALSEEA